MMEIEMLKAKSDFEERVEALVLLRIRELHNVSFETDVPKDKPNPGAKEIPKSLAPDKAVFYSGTDQLSDVESNP